MEKVFKFFSSISPFKWLVALIVFFPLSNLFFYWDKLFTSDWHNSIFLIGYQRLHLLEHWEFATVINTVEMMGVTIPLFYGYLFYPIMGLLSVPTNPHVTLRLAVCAIWLTQFLLVNRAALLAGASKSRSLLTATLLTWAIYPLTNLYTRSACVEFFGTAFLMCALACWTIIVNSSDEGVRRRYAIYFCLFLSLLAGTHPITAFYGGMLLGGYFIVTQVHRFRLATGKEECRFFIFSGIVSLLVVSPWLYTLVQFGSHIEVATTLSRVAYYPGIDHWWVRLLPLPFDYRALYGGTAIPTPYLDAQLCLPLLILLFAEVLWAKKRIGLTAILKSRLGKVQAALFVMFVFLFIVSVNPVFGTFLPILFGKIQIAYRWVSYLNAFLILMVFTQFKINSLLPGDGVRHVHLSTVLYTMAAMAVLLRLFHAYPITHEGGKFGYCTFRTDSDYLRMPLSYYSPLDYLTRSPFNKLDVKTPTDYPWKFINLKGLNHFGETEESTHQIERPGWQYTNLYPFPWNQLVVNGRKVASSELGLAINNIAVKYNSTEPMRIDYVFEPDPIYGKLRKLSFSLLGMLILVCVYAALEPQLKRRLPMRFQGSPI